MGEQDRKGASSGDRSLSGALIGGAFGFIGIAVFASASYADKVSSEWLLRGNIACTIAVALFLASIFFGGRGWTRKSEAGGFHPFNLQALTGLLGIFALGAGAAMFAFNPKVTPEPASARALVERLERIERTLSEQAVEISELRDRQEPRSVPPAEAALPAGSGDKRAPLDSDLGR